MAIDYRISFKYNLYFFLWIDNFFGSRKPDVDKRHNRSNERTILAASRFVRQVIFMLCLKK
jgi:hypothetical protein